jgi:15-cis-phytoene synthase
MPHELDEAYCYCQDLARRTGTNFYYSFLALPRVQRRAMCAVYAFMRVTDDLGDSAEPAEVREKQLADWRAALHGAINAGTSDDPVLAAVADVLRHYRIPAQYLDDVVTGVEMDLQPASFETFEQLETYCYHVAGAVGLTCIHLWGFHDDRAIAAAIDCGTAFQLTNILRDLREDLAVGRCYLPSEDLARFQISRESIGPQPGCDDRFRDLMQFEIARAREYYARAQALHEYLDPPGPFWKSCGASTAACSTGSNSAASAPSPAASN